MGARARERWRALWLLRRGWSEARVAEAFERDPHTIGQWLAAFGENGPHLVPLPSYSPDFNADEAPDAWKQLFDRELHHAQVDRVA